MLIFVLRVTLVVVICVVRYKVLVPVKSVTVSTSSVAVFINRPVPPC